MEGLIILVAAAVAIIVGACYVLKWIIEYPAEVFWIAVGIIVLTVMGITNG
jgi:drug/metabolite transporter superfamily protein YnfA